MLCKKMFVKWCPPGFGPKSSQSSMCDTHVNGCQFAPSVALNAHFKPDQVMPGWT
jgi:hypothetical protein